ncbi:MAG: hypothetical protein LBU92_03110 [Prevotellaceae bacterium]|jgi:hypothetical protein|nr:hypothetical protein [Prevotellaceae bacterium]
MKKFFYLVVALYIACLGMVGCSKNTAAPVITFGDNISQTTVAAGESKEISVTVAAEGKLKEVKYYRKKVGAEEIPFGKPVTKFKNSRKYECVITLRDITQEFVLVIEATDKKGRAVTAEYTVRVEGQGSNVAAFHRNLRMGFNMLNSVGSSYSVSAGKILLLPEAKQQQSQVDFMFFMGKDNGVTIAAPADRVVTQVFNNMSYGVQTWGARNATEFVKVNLDFENASAEDIAAAMNGSKSTKVNHLKTGDTVAFKTASGQVGLVKISNIGPNSASTLNVNVRTI